MIKGATDSTQMRHGADVSLDAHERPESAGLALSEAELTELALAADPSAPISPDAVPIGQHLAQFALALPEWYMPPAMARSGPKWRIPVIGTIIAAFVIIEGLGLCNTYGLLSLA